MTPCPCSFDSGQSGLQLAKAWICAAESRRAAAALLPALLALNF